MMGAKKMESAFCFICLEDVKVKTGRKRKEELMGKRKGEREFNLLVKYSLQTRSKTYDSVLNDILEVVGNGCASAQVGSSKVTPVKKLVRLCEKCETVGAKLLELHLELETIQMRIINEVQIVRRAVLNSSGWLGGIGKEGGSECFEQFSNKFCGGVASSKGQKKLLNVLKAFQTAVTEVDGDSVHIPLVYLDKYKIIVPPENSNIFLGTVPDIVKTEPIYPDETAPFQDAVAATSGRDCWLASENFVEGSDTTLDFYEEMRQGDVEDRPTVKEQLEAIPSSCVGEVLSSTDKTEINPTDIKSESEFDLYLKNENDNKIKNLEKSKRGCRRPKKTKSARKPLSKKKRAELRAEKASSKPSKVLRRVSRHYHCASCDFSCEPMSKFEQHLREHETDEKGFHCDKCNVGGFTNQQLYVLHQDRHRGRYKFKCDICLSYIDAFDLPTHLKTHVEEVFPCPYCSYCSSSRHMHLTHLCSCHSGVNLRCDICGASFETKRLLVEHLVAIHKAMEKIKCNYDGCNKTFSTKDALAGHKNIHTDRFACKVCHNRFSSKLRLEAHQLVVHSHEKPVKCDQCPESFTTAAVLQAHLIRDHGASKFECNLCGKKYCSTSTLRLHMGKVHNVGATKFCPICNKSFGVASRLRVHMESWHSKEHNYVCDECGKTFLSSTRYAMHKKIHGEKTHKCPYCTKMFSQRQVLRQHIRTHTGEKPYACEFCGKAFNQCTSRNAHRQKCQPQPTSLTGNITEFTTAV